MFYAVVTMNGRQIRKSLQTTNKITARVRLEKFRIEIRDTDSTRRDTELTGLPFTKVAGSWLQSIEAVIALRTLNNCRWCIKALAIYFPQTISKITRTDVDMWSIHRSQATKPSTFNKEAAMLKRIFTFAVERGALVRNPTTHLKFRKISKPQIAVPTREQFRALLIELRLNHLSSLLKYPSETFEYYPGWTV